ncbi:MAG: N-acetyl-gamma-glutamyl-phosphate reductase [Myxococcaceae bacterium]|nr:N-acetyl-gamma-glutamyl-phosphate reductase [Myxococcaceae bacterium]
MSAKVFIDGHAGTIGLRIRELLAGRDDLTLLEIDEARRKDPALRKAMLNECDIAVLCLPDDAAVEAVRLVENPHVRIIDGSTAHRVAEGWVYGLPELTPSQREAVAGAKRVANPGCWPTCVSLLLRPLLDAQLLPHDAPITIHGVSGYTGGGKAMIERWEAPEHKLLQLPYEVPYALSKKHKHLAEMMRYGGLSIAPQFVPAVGAYRCGMRVEIPLHAALLPESCAAEDIIEEYRVRYADERFIKLIPLADAQQSGDERTLDPSVCNGTNRVELRVVAHESGHVLLVAVLDNLGKGASGAAVQSLNLMLGLPEAKGLSA